MREERWTKLKAIFNSALDLDPNGRDNFVANACRGDEALRIEVEGLLASYRSEFIEGPVIEWSDDGWLKPGAAIGRYEVIDLLGVGGMGEVYLAKDNQLERKVAIKILNEQFEGNESNVQRFIREAKAVSSLNHPNILTIHEIGYTGNSQYIVSEYIEGQTLRTVLQCERQGLKKTLDISIQIAGALAAAHSAGIIHRDIKPENIVVRSDGYVKVLDFGLAKLIPAKPSIIGLEVDTVNQDLTVEGLILGTVSYMSPEQARGEMVDARTDIFSLGTLIYEMISGQKPFEADNQADTLVAILTRHPAPLTDGSEQISPELQHVIDKMLAKNREERFSSMQTVAAQLTRCRNGLGDHPVAKPTARSYSRRSDSKPAKRRSQALSLKGLLVLASITFAAASIALGIFYRSTIFVGHNEAVSTRSPAYDLYVRGKVKAESDNREEIEGAIKLLKEAVDVDPNYAEAYAALAIAYNTKVFQFASDTEKKKLNEDAEVDIEKALTLDPNSADAHFARGVILWNHAKRFPHLQTIQSYKRAIELNPMLDDAYHRLAIVYAHIGLLDEAQAEVHKCLEINPNNTLARFRAGTFDVYQGKYQDAIEVFKTVPSDISPSMADRNMADSLVHLGRLDEAWTIVNEYLSKYPNDEGGNITSVEAILFARAGKREEAEKTIARAVEIGQGFGHFHHTAYNIASAYAIMNMPDEAVKWLQAAADDGFPCYPCFQRDPNLDNLRSDKRFIGLMDRLKVQMDKFREIVESE